MIEFNSEDVHTLIRLYDEVVFELNRLDPLCQLSGWDTNETTKAAVERVRTALIKEEPEYNGRSADTR